MYGTSASYYAYLDVRRFEALNKLNPSIQSQDVLIVVDVSGSMGEANRYNLAKQLVLSFWFKVSRLGVYPK